MVNIYVHFYVKTTNVSQFHNTTLIKNVMEFFLYSDLSNTNVLSSNTVMSIVAQISFRVRPYV